MCKISPLTCQDLVFAGGLCRANYDWLQQAHFLDTLGEFIDFFANIPNAYLADTDDEVVERNILNDVNNVHKEAPRLYNGYRSGSFVIGAGCPSVWVIVKRSNLRNSSRFSLLGAQPSAWSTYCSKSSSF